MGTDNHIFLEIIEWFDESGQEMVHRIPEKGSGELKFGAQLIVRDSQAGVLFYKGKAFDAYGPGRHTLTTKNFPILTKALSLPWGFKSPLKMEARDFFFWVPAFKIQPRAFLRTAKLMTLSQKERTLRGRKGPAPASACTETS